MEMNLKKLNKKFVPREQVVQCCMSAVCKKPNAIDRLTLCLSWKYFQIPTIDSKYLLDCIRLIFFAWFHYPSHTSGLKDHIQVDLKKYQWQLVLQRKATQQFLWTQDKRFPGFNPIDHRKFKGHKEPSNRIGSLEFLKVKEKTVSEHKCHSNVSEKWKGSTHVGRKDLCASLKKGNNDSKDPWTLATHGKNSTKSLHSGSKYEKEKSYKCNSCTRSMYHV